MALAAFPPAVILYREEQNFEWWVYALFVAIEAMVWIGLLRGQPPAPPAVGPAGIFGAAGLTLGVAAVLVLPLLLVVGLLRMTTEVGPTHVRVWFGWLPTYRRSMAIGTIQKIEVVTYRPLADYGGWGIRIGRDGVRVLNARGNQGVRLDFVDGSRWLIGSQNPEALARALERSLRPGE